MTNTTLAQRFSLNGVYMKILRNESFSIKFCQEDLIGASLDLLSIQSHSNTCGIKDRYLLMFEFADTDASIQLLASVAD